MASAPLENAEVPPATQDGQQEQPAEGEEKAPAPVEAKLPTRKDISLKEFLNKMDDYAPIVSFTPSPPNGSTRERARARVCLYTYLRPLRAETAPLTDQPPARPPQIPDAVTNFYLAKAGLPPPPQTDPRLARLLALATQKFIADIAADSYQYSRIRASNTTANNPMGNLGMAAGIPMPGQSQPNAKDQGKGGPLGIQRAGYGGGGQGGSQNRTVLTMEDLGMAVGEYGVNVKRSEFYR